MKRFALFVLFLAALWVAPRVQGVTVNGSIKDVTGAAGPDQILSFTPLDAPWTDGLNIYLPAAVNVKTANGLFSVPLVQGTYRVEIGGRNLGFIRVPVGSANININSLWATYMYLANSGGLLLTNGLPSRAVVTDANTNLFSAQTTAVEIDYIHGLSGPLQSQLDAKAAVGHTHNGSDISAGLVAVARLPFNSATSAGIVASGAGQVSKIWMTDPNGNPAWRDPSGVSISYDQVTAGTFTVSSNAVFQYVPPNTIAGFGSGTNLTNITLVANDIPNLPASKISSGQLALARGGTGVDLSGTGGAGQVVRQATVGGAFTVSGLTLAGADFANQGTAHTILHGNAAGNPSWAAVDLASADVTGLLPAANLVGSGQSTITDGAGIGAGATFTVGSAYTLSANTATPRFLRLGLGAAADASNPLQIGAVFSVDSSGGVASSSGFVGNADVRAGAASNFYWNGRVQLQATSSSTLTVYASGATAIAGIRGGRSIITKTSNYTVLFSDSGAVFNNSAAAGEVDFTLPTWAVGLVYTFEVETAQILKVIAPGTDTIRIAGSASAGGGNVTNATIGGGLTIVAAISGKWMAIAHEGTWTVN